MTWSPHGSRTPDGLSLVLAQAVVAETYRANRSVHPGDAEEAMRRFPQLMTGLPFPFGSLYVPVSSGTTPVGVLVVLRYATTRCPSCGTRPVPTAPGTRG